MNNEQLVVIDFCDALNYGKLYWTSIGHSIAKRKLYM